MRFIVVVMLSALAYGCGVVPIPHRRELPGPIGGVRVVDDSTGADIADASVKVVVSEWKNWLSGLPPAEESKGSGVVSKTVAVGTAVTRRPPHGSRRAELPHRALALDDD